MFGAVAMIVVLGVLQHFGMKWAFTYCNYCMCLPGFFAM